MRHALCLVALAGCGGAQPQAWFSLWPDVVEVDPADPQPFVVVLEASWSDEARRGAAIERARFLVRIGYYEPLPEGILVQGKVGDVDIQTEQEPAVDGYSWIALDEPPCGPDTCERSVEITFDAGPTTEPFLVDISASAILDVTRFDDVPDVDGSIALSGP